MITKFILLLSMLHFFVLHSTAQFSSGKIIYERKTNIHKKYKDNDWVKENVREEDKIKVDMFELYFNDSVSVFKPQESDLKEKYSWATSLNTVYQNFNRNSRFTMMTIWGEPFSVTDSLRKRYWKITDSKRTISGYSCRKAIWQANDSTRIYAWYCDDIMTSTGPESFLGLPGIILGLATEDGGVIYFAKTVELYSPEIAMMLPQKSKNKIYTSPELKTKLEKQFGKEEWGKKMIENVFGLW